MENQERLASVEPLETKIKEAILPFLKEHHAQLIHDKIEGVQISWNESGDVNVSVWKVAE